MQLSPLVAQCHYCLPPRSTSALLPQPTVPSLSKNCREAGVSRDTGRAAQAPCAGAACLWSVCSVYPAVGRERHDVGPQSSAVQVLCTQNRVRFRGVKANEHHKECGVEISVRRTNGNKEDVPTRKAWKDATRRHRDLSTVLYTQSKTTDGLPAVERNVKRRC